MIRRVEGDQFWLIRQDDHARLAGQLAGHIGNARFAKPEPREATLMGVAEHDSGWPLHDDAPVLSSSNLPLDFREAPRAITHKVWLASAKGVAQKDPYAGLLASLHALSLSALSASHNPLGRFDVQQLRQQFELNKFQHAVIELLEQLRGSLGLRVDRPLRLGLSEGWTDEAEEQLKFNFRLLQAMDGLSLAICCDNPPPNASSPFYTRPAASAVTLQVHRASREVLLVKPWPFDQAEVRVSVPYRAVPNREYTDAADLHAAMALSEVAKFEVTLRSS